MSSAATVAIVPINALADAKSRLRGTISAAERAALVRWLAARVLGALQASAGVEQIAVVSPDASILGWAVAQGAMAIRQTSGTLNEGLELGRRWALDRDARSLLVVLGDLPLLTGADLDSLLAAGEPKAAPAVVLAPDRFAQGTNLLLLRPPDALPFLFGSGSLAQHRAQARAGGIEPVIFEAAGTSFDVDTPADLDELRHRGLWTPEEALCGESVRGEAR